MEHVVSLLPSTTEIVCAAEDARKAVVVRATAISVNDLRLVSRIGFQARRTGMPRP